MAVISLRAGESIVKGNAIREDVNGAALRADATTLSTSKVVGVAVDDSAPGDLVRVSTDSEVTVDTSNFVPGTPLFLDIGAFGELVPFTEWNQNFVALSADAQLTRVGTAIASNKLVVGIEPPQLMTYS